MPTANRFIPPYDGFKAVVALLLIFLIIFSWGRRDSVAAPTVAVDPSGNVTFSGEGAPSSAASLEISDDKGTTFSLSVQADDAGRWIASKRLPPGKYSLTARKGAASSEAIEFEVPESAALAEISVNADGGARTALNGQATPGEQLALFIDGVDAGRITVGSDGGWQVDLSAYPGVHTIQLAYARAPQITSATLTVKVPEPAPQAATANAEETVENEDQKAPMSGEENISGEAVAKSKNETPQPESGFAYTVKEDDWLTKLARDYLGSEDRYQEIRDATNARAKQDPTFATIEDDNLIYPGEVIWIPQR